MIDQRPLVLEFVDREIIEALCYHLRQLGVTFRLGEKVAQVGIDPKRDSFFAELESGKKVQGTPSSMPLDGKPMVISSIWRRLVESESILSD